MGFRKMILLSFTAMIICGLSACGDKNDAVVTKIALSTAGVTVEGAAIPTDSRQAVYLSHDVIYYKDRDAYESGNPYGEGGKDERHSERAAAAVSVVNITSPGTYRIFGTLDEGQIRVDLGEKAAKDKKAVVNLILDNAHVSCSVGPAILFRNVYECNSGEDVKHASARVDTAAAGANIILADGSINTVSGSHVAKIFKDRPQKEILWQQPGAVSSDMSMNLGGEDVGSGTLRVTADYDGIFAKGHLTVNGGNLNIFAGNNGISAAQKDISVVTVNDGNLRIAAGLGKKGDGIRSDGWLSMNGGTVVALANPRANAGFNSGKGTIVNGGTVVAFGAAGDWPAAESGQVTMRLQFAEQKPFGDAMVVADTENNTVFAYDSSADGVLRDYMREYTGVLISCPQFAMDDTYRVFVGGTVKGIANDGLYDIATITECRGGTEQSYIGTVTTDSGEILSDDFYIRSVVSCFSGVMNK